MTSSTGTDVSRETSVEPKDRPEHLARAVDALELTSWFMGEFDHGDAILTIKPGQGGLEAQDWTFMLFKMYMKYCARKGWKVTVNDCPAAEQIGIDRATITVEGKDAFGMLRAEAGVHRLVRISPFDASGRRHTSFASVEVLPELPDDNTVEIDPEDIKMEVANKFGMIQPSSSTTQAVRAVFVIDPEAVIRTILYYPASTGRNFDEIKRIVVALQKADAEQVATPANWRPGQDVIIPTAGSCGVAKERMESQDEEKYCLDWFLCFRREKK